MSRSAWSSGRLRIVVRIPFTRVGREERAPMAVLGVARRSGGRGSSRPCRMRPSRRSAVQLDLPGPRGETRSGSMVLAVQRTRRLSPELVGRRRELAALEEELGRAAAGEFRLVLLLGDAGGGKSRLARELLARHPEVTGLVAQAYPLAASAAFGLWTEAVEPFLRSLPDDQVV